MTTLVSLLQVNDSPIAMQPDQEKEEVEILVANVSDGGLLNPVWSVHTCRG
jgi:hypothetical protein